MSPASLFSFCLLECRDPFFPSFAASERLTNSHCAHLCVSLYCHIASCLTCRGSVKPAYHDGSTTCQKQEERHLLFPSKCAITVWIMIWLGKLSSLGLITVLHVRCLWPNFEAKDSIPIVTFNSFRYVTELPQKSKRSAMKSKRSNIFLSAPSSNLWSNKGSTRLHSYWEVNRVHEAGQPKVGKMWLKERHFAQTVGQFRELEILVTVNLHRTIQ